MFQKYHGSGLKDTQKIYQCPEMAARALRSRTWRILQTRFRFSSSESE